MLAYFITSEDAHVPETCAQCFIQHASKSGYLGADFRCDLWTHVSNITKYRHACCPLVELTDSFDETILQTMKHNRRER